ncbi:MAG: hypothetical protein Q9169_008534 [Polycauliona sp. 2 TL-2023]
MDTRVTDRPVQFEGGVVALVAANTLEALMFQLRRAGRIDGTWGDVPRSDIEMSLVSVEQPPYRFAAWAVQRTFEAASRRRYSSMISWMKWHGETVGHIEFGRHEADALAGNPDKADGKNSTLEIADGSVAVGRAGLGARFGLELLPGFTGVSMPLYDLMLSILTVMALAVEEGPETICPGITVPHFVLRSERVLGQLVLTWGYVITMMRVLVRWIVTQGKYEELGFLIKKDGARIAFGSIKQS